MAENNIFSQVMMVSEYSPEEEVFWQLAENKMITMMHSLRSKEGMKVYDM